MGIEESQAAVDRLIFLKVFLQRETFQKSRKHLENREVIYNSWDTEGLKPLRTSD